MGRGQGRNAAALRYDYIVTVTDRDDLARLCSRNLTAMAADTPLQLIQPHINAAAATHKLDISDLAFFINETKIEDLAARTFAALLPNGRPCTLSIMRKVGPTMLGRLTQASDEAGVRQLIQAGVKIDAGEVPALHYAAAKTDTVMMRLLIAETEGTEVDYCLGTVGHPGNTALNVALRSGVCEELAVLLIERGGATLIKNTKFTTDELPVAVAAYLGWSRVIRLIFQRRGGFPLARWDRRTPLQWARVGQLENRIPAAERRGSGTHTTRGNYEATISYLVKVENIAVEAVESKGLEKRRRQREDTNAEGIVNDPDMPI